MKVGDKVTYLLNIKRLDYGSVGIIKSIFSTPRGEMCSVYYPQNLGSAKIVYHSASLSDLKLVD